MTLRLVLRALWRMLEPKRRVILLILIVFLFVTGIFDMTGMLMIFGFISGLNVNDSGHRSGKFAHGLEWLAKGPLPGPQYLLLGGGAVVSVILFKNLLSMVVRYQLSRFLSNLNHRIALQLFAALGSLPYEEVASTSSSALKEELNATLKVFKVAFNQATQILADGAIVSMVLILLCVVNWQLTLFGLGLFGGLGLGTYFVLQATLRTMGRDERRASREVRAHLADGFGGLVEVRLRNRLSYFQKRFGRALAVMMRVERKRGALGRVPAASNEIILSMAIVGSVVYVTHVQQDLGDALPLLGVFGFAGMRMNGAMSRINRSFQLLRQKEEEFVERLEVVGRLAPKVLGSGDTSAPSYLAEERPLPPGRDGRLHESIELTNISFSYPGTNSPALRDVSLKIGKGQFVSFCGQSGGGKSTLLLLLMGLVRPSTGEVRCDGWNVHEHIRAWHRNIGYVGQAAYLSSASVRQNVAFGVPLEKIDDERVWAALDQAAAREFVELLPNRLETRLRGSGVRLSGGQRQRIVIARALYHNPDVVVFDEATAALDNITEREITEAALRLSRQKTIVCVAHRLSTIEKSDVIHVLHGGQIIASGSHAELLKTSLPYQALARAHLE